MSLMLSAATRFATLLGVALTAAPARGAVPAWATTTGIVAQGPGSAAPAPPAAPTPGGQLPEVGPPPPAPAPAPSPAPPTTTPASTEEDPVPGRRLTITTPSGPPLQGPHPFAQENALTVTAGYGFANQLNGVRGAIGYGREIAGSLWLDLRLDLIDGNDPAPAPQNPPCTNCAQVDTLASVLGGLSYRLRADIPVIPYAAVTAGPVFLFNTGARGAVGFALRASLGARYYLHEWLGFGIELGAVAGGAVVDEDAGLSANLAQFDLGISAEYQF